MKTELQDLAARPKRYNNIDGTGEIGLGVMALGFALLGYLNSYLRGVLPESWTGKVDPIRLLVFFGGMFAMLSLIK